MPSTKLFRHGFKFEQSCSAAMATQKLEEKVQQHDEVVESSKTGCRSQSRAHGKAYEQVLALICDTYARRIVCAATIWGGYFAHTREQERKTENRSHLLPAVGLVAVQDCQPIVRVMDHVVVDVEGDARHDAPPLPTRHVRRVNFAFNKVVPPWI